MTTKQQLKAALVGHCTRRTLYGHWFILGVCIECGLTKAAFAKRYARASGGGARTKYRKGRLRKSEGESVASPTAGIV